MLLGVALVLAVACCDAIQLPEVTKHYYWSCSALLDTYRCVSAIESHIFIFIFLFPLIFN